MELEDLRMIVFEERESGKLCEIPPEIFLRARKRLEVLYREARSVEHFLTEHGSELRCEIEWLEGTLQDITRERLRKIVRLALEQVENSYVDKNEARKMLPEEQEMLSEIICAVSQYRAAALGVCGESPGGVALFEDPEKEQECGLPMEEAASCEEETGEDSGAHSLVRVVADVEPFMGVDGRIYRLKKEDIVTIPSGNAQVLEGHNIALSIRVGK